MNIYRVFTLDSVPFKTSLKFKHFTYLRLKSAHGQSDVETLQWYYTLEEPNALRGDWLVQAAELVDEPACGETPGVWGWGGSAGQGFTGGPHCFLGECRGQELTPVRGRGKAQEQWGYNYRV